MNSRYFLIFWLCISPLSMIFGQQEEETKNIPSKKHSIFWNVSNILDPNGSSLQLGYDYECRSWLNLQLELGFTSDNLFNLRLPFEEYAGFRIRPQIKFLRRKSQFKNTRYYSGILLSYQQLAFSENKDFRIDDSFNQNISYRGKDQSYAWYIVGGFDVKSSRRITFSFSLALGEVYINTKVNEGEIPPNAVVFSDCVLFCGRSQSLDNRLRRPGILLDMKFGYAF